MEGVRQASCTGMTDEEWWEELGPLTAGHITPQRFPMQARVMQARVWSADKSMNPLETFEFGLQRLLDGLAAHISGARPPDQQGQPK